MGRKTTVENAKDTTPRGKPVLDYVTTGHRNRWPRPMLVLAIILVFLLAFWGATLFYEGGITWERHQPHKSIQLAFCEHVLFVHMYNGSPYSDMGLAGELHPIPDLAPYAVDVLGSTPKFLAWGFRHEYIGYLPAPGYQTTIIIPLWAPVFVLMLASIVFWSRRRQ